MKAEKIQIKEEHNDNLRKNLNMNEENTKTGWMMEGS